VAEDFVSLAARVLDRPARKEVLPIGMFLFRIHPARMRMLWEVRTPSRGNATLCHALYAHYRQGRLVDAVCQQHDI
jgi:hypothetical protein